MSLPLISIVVCTFNGQQYLQEQLDSIFAQSYPNIEVIVSDDGSTDATVKLLKSYAPHSNLKLIFREKNLGYSENFYQTALLANGAFIAFADQDDVWLPSKIEKSFHAIGKHSLLYGNSILINEKGEQTGERLSDWRNMQNLDSTISFVLENVAWGHTIMIKKELLSYYKPNTANIEYDKWLAVLGTSLSGIKYLNEPLTYYRRHNKMASQVNIITEDVFQKEAKRYFVFIKQLNWIRALRDQPLEKEKDFYIKLHELFSKKEQGSFVWPLFFFLLRFQKKLFLFKKKNFFSNLIEIRKLARSEHAPEKK